MVERLVANENVEGSNPFSRSLKRTGLRAGFFIRINSDIEVSSLELNSGEVLNLSVRPEKVFL